MSWHPSTALPRDQWISQPFTGCPRWQPSCNWAAGSHLELQKYDMCPINFEAHCVTDVQAWPKSASWRPIGGSGWMQLGWWCMPVHNAISHVDARSKYLKQVQTNHPCVWRSVNRTTAVFFCVLCWSRDSGKPDKNILKFLWSSCTACSLVFECHGPSWQ